MTSLPQSTPVPSTPAAATLRRIPVKHWLTACQLFSLVVCLAGAIAGMKSSAAGTDFPQFYMGAAMAAHGEWSALYPQPVAGATANAGYPDASTPYPAYQRIAAASSLPDTYRFINPPPVALALEPLALLPYHTALWLWIMLGAACFWGVTLQAGLIYRELCGQTTLLEGAIVAGAALLPRANLAARIGNMSPIIAFALGAAVLHLLRRHSRRASAAVSFGALAKYAPAVLLPLFVLRRQWSALAAFAAWTLAILLATLAITGIAPFKTFAATIWPTLQRPTFHWTNQSLWGISSELYGPRLSPALIQNSDKALEWITLALIAALLLWKRRQIAIRSAPATAAALLLIVWLLMFSPVTWAHYAVYLVPFMGWLAFTVQRSKPWLFVAAAAVALAFIPWNALPVPGAAGYLLSHFSLALGIFTLGIIAAASLITSRLQTEPA